MHAVIHCAGPSLDTAGLPVGDLRIAITGAILSGYEYDYWMISDVCASYCVTNRHPSIGTVLYPSTWGPDKRLDLANRIAHTLPAAFETYDVHQMRSDIGEIFTSGVWRRWSATKALVWAALRGATRIDVYGADLGGTSYHSFDTRTPKWVEASRWRQEREDWAVTVRGLRSIGVRVRRIRQELCEPVS